MKMKDIRWLLASTLIVGIAGACAAPQTEPSAEAQSTGPGCSEWTQPTEADFQRIVGREPAEFLDTVLTVIETRQVPMTLEGVKKGNKLFGAQILRKSDLTPVLVATNSETGSPLMHGEVTAITEFYEELPKEEQPAPADTIFVATHEPCPLCLSSITWGGFDNFFYLFTYEDSRDEYGIPHDIVMIDEIFRCPEGSYNEKNKYWSSWSLARVAAMTSPEQQEAFDTRIAALKAQYAELSDIYQAAKAAGTGADVPLK